MLRRNIEVPRPSVENTERAERGYFASMVIRCILRFKRLRQIAYRVLSRAMALGEDAEVVKRGALASLIAHCAAQRERLFIVLRRFCS